MHYDHLCDTCYRRYEGCYLYEYFIKPLEAEGVVLEVKDCTQYADELTEVEDEL